MSRLQLSERAKATDLLRRGASMGNERRGGNGIDNNSGDWTATC